MDQKKKPIAKLTPKEPFELSQEIKKSRFIAKACRVETKEEALKEITSMSDPEATHNCWAYKIGEEYRFNDDGEPGGTAGRPILAAIESQDFDHVLVIVTRFFGGIKLGAGGLSRAYGGTAAKCLHLANIEELHVKIALTIKAPFDAIGTIHSLFDAFNARKIDESYNAIGVALDIEIEERQRTEFERQLTNATRGQVYICETIHDPQ